jgi:hypothetical protein
VVDRFHRVGLIAAGVELLQPLISILKNEGTVINSKKLLTLYEAETIAQIDREILLQAILNKDLLSSRTARGYGIKYKDLEQFIDRYYYTKNPMLGSYRPK